MGIIIRRKTIIITVIIKVCFTYDSTSSFLSKASEASFKKSSKFYRSAEKFWRENSNLKFDKIEAKKFRYCKCLNFHAKNEYRTEKCKTFFQTIFNHCVWDFKIDIFLLSTVSCTNYGTRSCSSPRRFLEKKWKILQQWLLLCRFFWSRRSNSKLVFFVAIVAWENGDDGKCSPQWNDLGHFAELNWCSPTRHVVHHHFRTATSQ